MPTVAEFNGVVVIIFRQDHDPPHFHVRYAEFKAVYGIDPIRRFAGRLPPPVHRMVIEWAARHQAELRENWLRARAHEELRRIPPDA